MARYEPDNKTTVGVKIDRDIAQMVRDSFWILAFILGVFVLLGALGFFQYRNCKAEDEDVTFLECIQNKPALEKSAAKFKKARSRKPPSKDE